MTDSDLEAQIASAPHPSLPSGFRFAGVYCGIKPSRKLDLSLVVGDREVQAAGVYTQNQIVAAPVLLCRSRTPSSRIRAVVTNSGNANACTGEAGKNDAQEMSQQVATCLGCDPSQVLVMSTGVIGRRLPMDQVRQGINAAYEKLDSRLEAFRLAADAICTTDQSHKTVFREFVVGDQSFRIAAMAKGGGDDCSKYGDHACPGPDGRSANE